MISLAFGNKVAADFRIAVIDLCKAFNWTPDHANWLMACMAFESAETFSPSIRNAAGSGAVGLIQFMPATAVGLGTTSADLAKMTAVQQLEYVKRYFRPYSYRIKSLSDMYLAILLPAYIGKPEGSILFSSGVSYRQNAGLDKNHDGKITKAEAASKVLAKLVRGLGPGFVLQVEWST